MLDIACDRGDFIRNIDAREKWATDIRDMSQTLTQDLHFVQANGLELDHALPVEYFDVAFMSNYLEHLGSSDNVLRQLKVTSRVLEPGGCVIVPFNPTFDWSALATGTSSTTPLRSRSGALSKQRPFPGSRPRR